MARLEGKRVAILATDGFEQVELTAPRDALTEAGARAEIVSPKPGEIQGFHHFDRGDSIAVDRSVEEALETDYDALVIPGGLFNPDVLRIDETALRFTRDFVETGKPVAAICHGPWVLVNAEVVRGRKLTAFKSIRRDLKNAGAQVVDEEVVVDRNLITSRTPDDLPAFCEKLLAAVATAVPPASTRKSPDPQAVPLDRQITS